MTGLFDYYTNILGLELADISYIDADLAFAKLDPAGDVFEMAFGDPVTDVSALADGRTSFTIVGGRLHGRRASVKGELKLRKKPLLRLSMIDVQQGDGLILDTPEGKLVTIDGGDNQLFARHVAARFSGTTAQKPLKIDAMIVTHGDADHFLGLVELVKAEAIKNTAEEPDRAKKRVFVSPAAIFHNGLVKRPSNRAETAMFGATAEKDGALFVTGLVESPLDLPETEMNKPFKTWAGAIAHWRAARAAAGEPDIIIKRIDQKSKSELKARLGEKNLAIEPLGPTTSKIAGGPALEFLRAPAPDPELHLLGPDAPRGALSASHTINGHSIAFRLVYKNVRFLFTGDLNQESMARLAAAKPDAELEAEILKVPHHGSSDFDFGALKKVKPVVSIISSGDESAKKEYIHPRASLVSALGRVARTSTGIIFITELAAFFAVRGYATETHPKTAAENRPFFAFERANFGVIHIRTDGERVVAFTHSGKRGMNEAYAFTVDAGGEVKMKKKLAVARG